MSKKKVALIGNPNAGKTSLFNELTGLNQQVGNFPGVTVDKKIGSFSIDNDLEITLIDLPGTYSLNPSSKDEEVVLNLFKNPSDKDYPELVLVIVDFTNLERNLFLFTQLQDLNIPCILACNMMDLALQKGITADLKILEEKLKAPVVSISAKKGKGIKELKVEIKRQLNEVHSKNENDFLISEKKIKEITENSEERYQKIKEILSAANYNKINKKTPTTTQKLDKIFTHPILGYFTFLAILFLVFQAVFSFAEAPMDWIDGLFQNFSQAIKTNLPSGLFTNLLAEGIIPGVGGIVIFIPQITLLFLFIAILEESGYMARVVFIMDRIMRPLGLSGRSIVPLVSSVACAIPAIMAARTINNWKDKIITIMVAPLVSCSARIPVYTLLIALVIPDKTVLGIFNLKGIVLLSLYLLGFIAVFISAIFFKILIKQKGLSFLILELPEYRAPKWKNTFLTIWEKVNVFVWDAGKIILAVSIILWSLASFGPSDLNQNATNKLNQSDSLEELTLTEKNKDLANLTLENSYIGILGKSIEPLIKPLGYDWKIGISLITSFAAREVFVGSMATIYSVGEDFEEDHSLIERMKAETNPQTGQSVYSLETGVSLMVFYAFAMQCMSTLAIVKRETKSWKWPLIQLLYMSILAYGSAFLVFNLLN